MIAKCNYYSSIVNYHDNSTLLRILFKLFFLIKLNLYQISTAFLDVRRHYLFEVMVNMHTLSADRFSLSSFSCWAGCGTNVPRCFASGPHHPENRENRLRHNSFFIREPYISTGDRNYILRKYFIVGYNVLKRK